MTGEGARPTHAQRSYLERGLEQPGGKLPLFDRDGQQISVQTIRACIEHGWAEPWFRNPIKQDWLVCRLTERGRDILARSGPASSIPPETDEGDT